MFLRFKSPVFTFSFISLLLYSFTVQLAWAKPEIKMSFKMFPSAGNFEVSSSEIQGFAISDGTKVKADNIIIPVSSLNAGLELRTKHMKEKYLQIEKFPQAKLIHAEGENGKGKAQLEIHGEKSNVEGTYKTEGEELIAEFKSKISDYKIDKVKYLGVGVQDEFTVEVRVPLKKNIANPKK